MRVTVPQIGPDAGRWFVVLPPELVRRLAVLGELHGTPEEALAQALTLLEQRGAVPGAPRRRR